MENDIKEYMRYASKEDYNIMIMLWGSKLEKQEEMRIICRKTKEGLNLGDKYTYTEYDKKRMVVLVSEISILNKKMFALMGIKE